MSKINLQAETTNSGEQEEQREKADNHSVLLRTGAPRRLTLSSYTMAANCTPGAKPADILDCVATPRSLAYYCDERVCLCVYVSVCERISETGTTLF